MTLDIIFPKAKPMTAIKKKPLTKPLPKTQIHELKETAPTMDNKENIESHENKNLANAEIQLKPDENPIHFIDDPTKPPENPSKLAENPSKEVETLIKPNANPSKDNDPTVKLDENEINKVLDHIQEKNIAVNVEIASDLKPTKEKERFPVVGYPDEENMW